VVFEGVALHARRLLGVKLLAARATLEEKHSAQPKKSNAARATLAEKAPLKDKYCDGFVYTLIKRQHATKLLRRTQ
jgi:predicted HAD superfamily hydrolase